MVLGKHGDCIIISSQALRIPAWFEPVFSERDV